MAYVNAPLALTLVAFVSACGGGDSGAVSVVGGAHPADHALDASAATQAALPGPGPAVISDIPLRRLPAPELDELPANTWRLAVTVTGRAQPFRTVVVAGERTAGVGEADKDGGFEIGVELAPQRPNRLRVTAIDPDGVESEPTFAGVEQDAATVRTALPIVLHHGYMGFRELVGVPYWWGIVEHLEEQGFDVRTTAVAPLATVEERASELVATVRRITSGRINLVGHSMGGLDSRYAVSMLGLHEQVATVTTVGTPHRGSPVADVVLGGREELAAEWLLERLGIPAGGLADLSVARATGEFNKRVLDMPGTQYFSWSSVTDPFGLVTGAPLNPLFAIPFAIVEREEGDNDGLVSVTSAQWGEHLGTLSADHLDQVGHLLGLTDDFDQLRFWQDEAERLEAAGF